MVRTMTSGPSMLPGPLTAGVSGAFCGVVSGTLAGGDCVIAGPGVGAGDGAGGLARGVGETNTGRGAGYVAAQTRAAKNTTNPAAAEPAPMRIGSEIAELLLGALAGRRVTTGAAPATRVSISGFRS